MRNAYECREHYNKDGKCIKRERTIGGIVVFAFVVVVAIISGYSPAIPSTVWQQILKLL